MSNIPQEVIDRFSAVQGQIWQTVSLTLSEAAGATFNCANPLTVVAETADLFTELSTPKLVIQFAFANSSENAQAVLIDEEDFLTLARFLKDDEVKNADDNLVGELKPSLEAFVQGLCIACGNIRNEAMAAGGQAIRFHIFSFPPNLRKEEQLLRTNIAISSEDLSINATWLVDNETAHTILSIPMDQDEDEAPFQQMAGSSGVGGVGLGDGHGIDGSLEILMDIPLEISVELGRVKMVVRDVVELGTGSIVEIDKAAGEPVDVMVNGRLVARGEVVVIEDNFGVRITEILSAADRLAKLSEAA